MTNRSTRDQCVLTWTLGGALLLGIGNAGSTARAQENAAIDAARLFRETLEPVLETQCFGCHSASASKVKGGLLLDTAAGRLRGGDSGPAIVPGKSGESLLLLAIRHEGGMEMPPKKPKLPTETVNAFARWIDAGAPDPSDTGGSAGNPFAEEARYHWAFQPLKPVAIPQVADSGWVRTPIDAFVLQALEARKWHPSSEASRGEWIRRVTFDLTGLPPTPEEIEAFEHDDAPNAYERVVDRLLASPRHGERWAQHWFDVVRFAESEGYEYDRHLPDSWRYRDYVIDAWNRDKPYDRFLLEQIAGDEVGPNDPECLTASSFHRLGPVRRNAGNPEIALSRNEVLTERTDILGTAFLGLTIGCARCHQHKLEPIAQKDYYRLQAYLAASEEHNVSLADPDEQKTWERKTKAIKDEMEKLKTRMRRLSGAERERLATELEKLDDSLPPQPATIPAVWNDREHRTAIHVLRRGVWENKGEPVGPRPPSVLMPESAPELAADLPNPRTELARWLTDPSHPLTARVFVNRLWQRHFGEGIVRTLNDFGTKGERPSHPELLDWLTARFLEGGMRAKPIHRLIVLSAAYRQSSRAKDQPEAARDDPQNRLLWHFSRRRLSAEEIRDAMLAVSGRLYSRAGGPGVMVPVEAELVKLLYKPSQWQVTPDRREHDRRTVYLFAKRNLRLPFLDTFDAPPALTSCPRRESSTHAPQALELLNGDISNELAEAFAARLSRASGGDHERMIDLAFRLALGRPPVAAERERSLAFLREQPAREFALALFNLNGFLYVP